MHNLLSLENAMLKSGFSRPQIYKLISEGKFPKQITMGRRSFWLESEINEWIFSRIAERNSKQQVS